MTHFSFSTCDFCDVVNRNEAHTVRALPAVFKNFAAHTPFFGEVCTVQCFEDNTSVRALLETAGNNRVLLVAGGGSLRTALLGGNLGALAAKNGWAGVVVDGCVRDVQELADLPVGIRALASMPMPPCKRQAGLVDIPVHIQGVLVYAGDWLYADADGTVVSSSPLHSYSA